MLSVSNDNNNDEIKLCVKEKTNVFDVCGEIMLESGAQGTTGGLLGEHYGTAELQRR